MILQPTSTSYPADDDRFEKPPSSYTLTQACAWVDDAPPSPEFNVSAEDYMAFTKRQTSYAAYRNAVVEQRDKLKRSEGQLLIPKAPVGEDIMEAINWIQSTGATPLEFLTKTYRDSTQQMGHRLTAAAKLMDYVHRKMPSTVEHSNTLEISAKSIDPTALASLSEKELASLEKLLDKMATKTTAQ